jgi:hypothetical protein
MKYVVTVGEPAAQAHLTAFPTGHGAAEPADLPREFAKSQCFNPFYWRAKPIHSSRKYSFSLCHVLLFWVPIIIPIRRLSGNVNQNAQFELRRARRRLSPISDYWFNCSLNCYGHGKPH